LTLLANDYNNPAMRRKSFRKNRLRKMAIQSPGALPPQNELAGFRGGRLFLGIRRAKTPGRNTDDGCRTTNNAGGT
jgi:hypothetical protein